MMKYVSPKSIAALIGLFLFVFLPFGFVSDGQALANEEFGKGAETFVQSLADEAIDTLAVKEIPQAERVKRFRTMLGKHFDVNAIGRWVLGRYWRKASKAQQAEYLVLFRDLIVATYVNQFAELTGERLKVTQSLTREGKKDAIVRSEIIRTEGQPPIKLDWRVRAPKGNFKVVDVVVEGVSMSQTQRSEFGSVIKREGGEIDGLLAALRKKTKSLRIAEKGPAS
ncbi:MAG: ABC transporter substrate-binding protein [Alphaproteobacteria bacterium]|nr:ABC transporter substrate-binding protein [Rhodospirillales bacterium]MCW9044870.1 ABC transporter substrate-binding protein [Alphaproteobacteria bacterium]